MEKVLYLKLTEDDIKYKIDIELPLDKIVIDKRELGNNDKEKLEYNFFAYNSNIINTRINHE